MANQIWRSKNNLIWGFALVVFSALAFYLGSPKLPRMETIPLKEVVSEANFYHEQEIVVKGFVNIETDHITLWEKWGGESEYIFLKRGKFQEGDVGLIGKKVILKGVFKKISCEPKEITFLTCGLYLTEYHVLGIK